jgi:hypothetical protein
MLGVDETNFTRDYYRSVFPLGSFAQLGTEPKLFADVILKIGENNIPCHKIVLLSFSPKLFQVCNCYSISLLSLQEEFLVSS